MNIIYIQDQEIDHYNGHFYHSKSEHFFSRFLAGLKENDTLTVYAGIITRKSAHEVEKYKMWIFAICVVVLQLRLPVPFALRNTSLIWLW